MQYAFMKFKGEINNSFNSVKQVLCMLISLSLLLANGSTISSADPLKPDIVRTINDRVNSEDVPEDLFCNSRYNLGGSYYELCDTLRDFESRYPSESGKYEVYYLIHKNVLNAFVERLKAKGWFDKETMDFLNDNKQSWAPAVILSKEDYESARSYFNPEKQSIEEQKRVIKFMGKQLKDLWDLGCFHEWFLSELFSIECSFDHKYNQASKQVYGYMNYLNFQFYNGTVQFNHPYDKTKVFSFAPFK